MFSNDNPVVLTLDAGGTNMVFSALKGNAEIVSPVRLRTVSDDLPRCLATISEGFRRVLSMLREAPSAISFAFPGPADYEKGIIGDLPNFSCFRGGVPLGDYLREKFGLPVFINNDGNLFALGQATAGFLPYINKQLTRRSPYRNLIGITLGTGFGAGVVVGGTLLKGDNGCGGDVWLMRNYRERGLLAEESVSIRAVCRVYRTLSSDARDLSPKDIYEIAEGRMDGNKAAARESFASMGRGAADAIISALNIVDGLVVIGGGLAASSKYFFPSMRLAMEERLRTYAGLEFPLLQMKPFFIDSPSSLSDFLAYEGKKTAIGLSGEDTSHSISVGAYAYALACLS